MQISERARFNSRATKNETHHSELKLTRRREEAEAVLCGAVARNLLRSWKWSGKCGRACQGYGRNGLRDQQVGREGARKRTQANRRCHALRPHPRRSRRTDDQRGLRGKVRIYARRELEG